LEKKRVLLMKNNRKTSREEVRGFPDVIAELRSGG